MRIRRTIKLWRNGWRERLNALRLRYDQWRCLHMFRPARINDSPGKYCRICQKTERLTPEEFFAEFGEHIWQR